MRLLIGNKCYSSWSLRAWLPMRAKGIGFTEKSAPLDEPWIVAQDEGDEPAFVDLRQS